MISLRDVLTIVIVVVLLLMLFGWKAYPLVVTGPVGLLILVLLIVVLIRGGA
jgi:hypothetical protein